MVNLAHGLTPEHTVDNVKFFVDESIRQSKLYKAKQILEWRINRILILKKNLIPVMNLTTKLIKEYHFIY